MAKHPVREMTAPVMITICQTTNAVMCVPVSQGTANRYLRLHDLVPEGLPTWADELLEELVEELDDDAIEAWERVLILLAHHRSVTATRILSELRFQAPPELAEFGELAYAESLGWLGYDYVREPSAVTPIIRPTSASHVQ